METIYQKFTALNKTKQFLSIVQNRYRQIRDNKPIISVSGLAGVKSLLALVLYRTMKNNLIYLAKDSETKNHIHSDLLSFLPEENIIMFNDVESAQIECARMFSNENPFILIVQPDDLEIELPRPEQWAKHRLHLAKGAVMPIESLADWLNTAQYQRLDLVSEPGEFAVRGSIVDIFPPKSDNPIRVEFLDNEIVSLRYFDTITQRSINFVSEIEIFAQKLEDSEKTRLIDLIPQNSLVISEVADNNFSNTILMSDDPQVFKDRTPKEKDFEGVRPFAEEFDFGFSEPPIYLANFPLLKSEIESSALEYIFVSPQEYQYQRLVHIFGDKPKYVIGNLHSGILAQDDGFCVVTEKELYGAPVMRQPRRKFKGQPLDDLLALSKGDYVVHVDYGIGQFEDVVRLKMEPAPISEMDEGYKFKLSNKQVVPEDKCGVEKDFLLIRYANDQKLYVPVENLGLIERYIGGDDLPPTLSNLGTSKWLLTKVKIARATEAYAQELINLYAERSIAKKEPFNKDTEWQEEFEASFAYEETPDQLKALDDVKRDLENRKPMDRLICGDTGFGKTEIALRAAFKSVIGLKQVAVLVPTTILCYQHYHTFKKRFENFPVRIEMLSRFTQVSKRKKIISDLKIGKVDIVIGTHTLISPNIEFKNLGLLVIDEEHKFGVKQKEKIKKIKANLDVLTLTATPIPRTLYRSLVGLSDISSIHTPPPGRRDIITSAIYWDDQIIYQRINEEIKRGGQVLFIHNRINSIKNIAKKLQNLNQNWRIAVTHSKLPEKFLAQIYMDFLDNKFDILVSTAIIESGLDMPNVNTIIVNRADWFGLSDLHQLRGRVGRSDKQAYAIFILPESFTAEHAEKKISDSSTVDSGLFQKRISTILAYSKLGAGFRLAMRDMELRGVGNLLGTEQHGYVNQIGLNLYQNMLKDAIAKIKGEKISTEPILSLDVPAFIPEDYIPDSYERVAIYKRLLSLESETELKLIAEELKDRFGKYPSVMENLFSIASIRLKARELNLLKVSFKNNIITIVNPKKTTTLSGNLATLEKVLSSHLSK
jgi:transcription-repair coupling factor (superfamily II helicase)